MSDDTPRDPRSTLPTPEQAELSTERTQALARTNLTTQDLSDWLGDLVDPLSPEDRAILAAYVEHSGDTKAMAAALPVAPDGSRLTPARVRSILAQPKLRRSLARILGHQASPEAIVARLSEMAFGPTPIAGKSRSITPKGSSSSVKWDHRTSLEALKLLAQLRGLLVDNIHIRASYADEEDLDRLLGSEIARVRGVLPGSADVVDVEPEPVPQPESTAASEAQVSDDSTS